MTTRVSAILAAAGWRVTRAEIGWGIEHTAVHRPGRSAVTTTESTGQIDMALAGVTADEAEAIAHVLTGAAPAAPAVPVDPRDAVVAAARALVASWSVTYPAKVDPQAAISFAECDLDDALARLDTLTYERSDEPPTTDATAADHWQPTGRPVSAPPAGSDGAVDEWAAVDRVIAALDEDGAS